MKIAHLADLHIGKKLEEIDRNPEIKTVLNEAAQIIENENVKIVLLAGDIFEHARPSVDSMDIFYQFLKNLKAKKVEKILIIAGNHDDEALLEVAKSFLEFSGIHIWGKITGNMDSYFLKTEFDGETLFFTALPYLNDIKILSEMDKKRIEGKSQAQRYVETYQVLMDFFKQQAALEPKESTKIMIAHLFLEGSELSHTERESTLEQYLCIPKDVLENNNPFDYIALGHIHKYQDSLSKFHKIFYSGSVIRLNFGEKNDKKGFRIFDTITKKVEFIELQTPKIMEEFSIDLDNLSQLNDLESKKDSQKLYKIRINYASGLMPLEIREKIREILGSFVKMEFQSKKDQSIELKEIRTIEKVEDLMLYYKEYKKNEENPEVLEKLQELTRSIFEK